MTVTPEQLAEWANLPQQLRVGAELRCADGARRYYKPQYEAADAIDALIEALEVAQRDTARLDWLQAHSQNFGSAIEIDGSVWIHPGPDLRAALDEAMSGVSPPEEEPRG